MSIDPPDVDPEATRPRAPSPAQGIRQASLGGTSSSDAARASDAGPPPGHPRYGMRSLLGKGGQGVVWRVHDRELGRDVALKTMRPEKVSIEVVERFLREAQATAVLEHPNIVPIYDVGRLDDGRPFYTMRLVPGRSFADVLAGLRDDELSGREDAEWSLVRLLQVAQQACLALQFAHERGVVHRDVKPGNVLLGEHGEVLLVDWGIAKLASGVGPQTTTGVAVGTMHYMSPEQACGQKVDARADVYALGVLLYQALSLRLPFEDTSAGELIAAILRDEPPPVERRTRRVVPRELCDLVARALAKRREDRVQSAREIHDALQAFIEGVAEKGRRAREASRLTAEGIELLRRHEATLAELTGMASRIAALSKAHPSWQPLAEKKPLLAARRLLESCEARARTELLTAVHRLTDALAHAPDHAEARALLADAFLARLRDSERARESGLSEVWLSLVERYHDGRHSPELAGLGTIRVSLEPSSAEWTLHRLVEEEIALVDGPVVARGRGDVALDGVAMGSYVLIAAASGFEPARYPVAIFRNTRWSGSLRLLPLGTLPEGFVYIPGTDTWLGGDSAALNPRPLRRVRVESFAIARFPVTFREWCAFLDSLPPEEARLRIPRTESMGPLCEAREGRHEPVGLARILAPWTKERYGDDCSGRIPVMGVNAQDSEDFCRWAAGRVGRVLRLPSGDEWELAARGVDRRTWSFGERFDATACHCRESTPLQPDLAPVGAAELDVSPCGVRDLTGGIHELTCSAFDEAGNLVEVRGGSWQASGATLRSASRSFATAGTRTGHLGVRMAFSISDEPIAP
jgi:eukaryotic-like serine/threonine-protein kinase